MYNVEYLLYLAEIFATQCTGLESLCNYESLYSLKREMWNCLREALPQLPTEKLIFLILWRTVFGVRVFIFVWVLFALSTL